MTKVLYDVVLRQKLPDLEQSIQLCDESGHVLARIVPVLDPDLYTNLEPRISDEELSRRRSSKGKTYTTAEVLAYLERL